MQECISGHCFQPLVCTFCHQGCSVGILLSHCHCLHTMQFKQCETVSQQWHSDCIDSVLCCKHPILLPNLVHRVLDVDWVLFSHIGVSLEVTPASHWSSMVMHWFFICLPSARRSSISCMLTCLLLFGSKVSKISSQTLLFLWSHSSGCIGWPLTLFCTCILHADPKS